MKDEKLDEKDILRLKELLIYNVAENTDKNFQKDNHNSTIWKNYAASNAVSYTHLTLAKRGDLHARRQVLAYVYDEDVVSKLFDEIAPKYADRNGGYTRILKLGPRRGDNAEVVFLELV